MPKTDDPHNPFDDGESVPLSQPKKKNDPFAPGQKPEVNGDDPFSSTPEHLEDDLIDEADRGGSTRDA